MGPELTTFLEDAIPRIAARQHRKTTPAMALEDLEQEMWLAAVEHETMLEQHQADGNDAAIRTILNRAVQHALQAEEREERAKKALDAGYKTQDEIFYSLGLLRRLLPLFYEKGYQEHKTNTADEYQVAMMDIGHALTAIPGHRQRDLKRYFSYPPRYMVEWNNDVEIHGYSHTEIAHAMGVRPDILGTRIYHALKALQKALGGQNPWNRGPAPRKGRQG